MSSTVLVTGGAGFIGSHLVEALVERGDHVKVIDNLCTGRRENLAAVNSEIEFYPGDICDKDLMQTICQEVDTVFHQAALASVQLSVEQPGEVHRACVTGTLTVLDAARANGVRRVVYAGSSSCYGNHEVPANREIDPLQPLSPYAAAKLAGEMYCTAFYNTYGLETVCLRYFNVFGPRQDPDSPYSAVIPIFISRLVAGKSPTIFGDGLQSRDFTFVSNVVDANLLAADAAAGKVGGKSINLASGQSTNLLDLLAELQSLCATDIPSDFAEPRAGEVKHSQADIQLAQTLLDYSPKTDLQTGLAHTVAYYQQHLADPGASTTRSI